MPKRGKPIKEEYYLGNPNLPSGESQFDWTPEMLRDLARCKEDILYFAENFFYIINLDTGRQKIQLHPYQRRILKSVLDNRHVIVISSRQAGKTTLMTIFALWLICFNEDQRILIVANKEATAINIFRRIRLAYEMLPNFLKSGVKEYGKTSIQLANGSSIGISTTSSDAARGESVNCMFIDEMAHVDGHIIREFFTSVYPVISSSKKAKMFICSTPNGTDNLFCELYTNAERGLNNWKAEKVNWWEIPGRDELWRENTIKEMGSVEAFEQEFNCKFLQSGESATPDDVYEELRKQCCAPKHTFDEDHYFIWEEPNPDALYVAGVDISEGVGEAASCIQILDVTDLTCIKQVAEYHHRKIQPIKFTTKLLEILQHWGKPPAAIERNNCGAQVIDQLRSTHGYEAIVNVSPKDNEHRLGCINHTNTKYRGVVNMRYWINELRAVQLRDIHTVNELKGFIRHPNGTWQAKGGVDSWDDRVMALLWGLIVLDAPEVTERFFEVVKLDDHKKPLLIRPMEEFAQREMMNPSLIYTDESRDTEGAQHRILPTVYQPNYLQVGSVDSDVEDLESQGWSRLY